MMAPGTWWIRSMKDPRWNASGPSPAVGMFGRPPEVDDKIADLKKTYGDPPDDVEWGYMKD
jgi:hypothetical protein